MKKFFPIMFASIAITLLFTPLTADAQTDQRCWRKKECIEYRKNQPWGITEKKELEAGFYMGKDSDTACSGYPQDDKDPWGFCLPATTAQTRVSFSGRNEFAHLGEFIAFIYQYGFIIGSILAVVMIIFAGTMWIFSGGNSDTIGNAKKKIGGAVVGLTLLALSYTVLNLINPYLVNLRMPQVWLINEQLLAPDMCKDDLKIKDGNKKITEAGKGIDLEKWTNEQKQAKFKEKKPADFKTMKELLAAPKDEDKEPKCGYEYFIDGEPATTMCSGHICEKTGNEARSCLTFDYSQAGASGFQTVLKKDKISEDKCWQGELVIHYRINALWERLKNIAFANLAGHIEQSDDDLWLEDQGTSPEPDNQIQISSVCQSSGDEKYIAREDVKIFAHTTKVTVPNDFDEFIFQFKGSSLKELTNNTGCKSNETLAGILIRNQINEQNSWGADTDIIVHLTAPNSTQLTATMDENWVDFQMAKELRPNLLDLAIPLNVEDDEGQYYEIVFTESLLEEITED